MIRAEIEGDISTGLLVIVGRGRIDNGFEIERRGMKTKVRIGLMDMKCLPVPLCEDPRVYVLVAALYPMVAGFEGSNIREISAVINYLLPT
jgi:hypothetical protein